MRRASTLPGGSLVANRPFSFGGRAYKPGDRFDAQRTKADERRMLQLLDQRKIVPAKEFDVSKAPKLEPTAVK